MTLSLFVGVSILGKLIDLHIRYLVMNLCLLKIHWTLINLISTLVGSIGSGWHTSEAEIHSSYRSFSNEKIHGKMGIYIGLNSANVTLEAMHYNKSMDVNFNER